MANIIENGPLLEPAAQTPPSPYRPSVSTRAPVRRGEGVI